MRKLVIFGDSQLAQLMHFYLQNSDNNYRLTAFTVDAAYLKQKELLGLPVVAFEDVARLYPPQDHDMMICLGYTAMNRLRQAKFAAAQALGYHIASYTHPAATVLTDDLGTGNIILDNANLGVGVKIGDGNILYPRAYVAHHSLVGDFNFITSDASISGNNHVHNNCFFGNNCTTNNDIEIASYTLVGACCYVAKSTKEHGVYVPAMSICLENKTSDDFM